MTRTSWLGWMLVLALVLGGGLALACGGDDDDDDSDDDDNDTTDDDTTDDDTTDDDTTDDDDTVDDDTTDDDDDSGNALNDDFDDYDLGSPPPDPWDVYEGAGATIAVVDSKDGSGRWVNFSQMVGGDNATLGYVADSILTGTVTWEFDILFSDMANSEFYFTLGGYAEGGCNANFHASWLPDPESITAEGTGDAVSCTAWPDNDWHTVKFVADTVAGTFSVFFDDAATACASMEYNGLDFNCIAYSTDPGGAADVDLDNVHLSGELPSQ